jgi:hypothetical protein
VRAYLSIERARADGTTSIEEHELHGPLAAVLVTVADHLDARCRGVFERIARIDRERARGRHELAYDEMLELAAAAYQLLAEPPQGLRRSHKLVDGPHPYAQRLAPLVDWLRAHHGHARSVHYDLWCSQKQVT